MSSQPSTSTGVIHCNIPDLPVEVLSTIFKYLSTRERKAVKLVCKFWFETCNSLPLTNNEVLNCLRLYQLSDTFGFLNRSERRFLNLKFVNVHFDSDSSFWKTNCSRIRSIIFKDCLFFNDILEDIIVLCRNLSHLSFKYYRMCLSESYLQPIVDLERISENGIVRQNLNSLSIRLPSWWTLLSDHTINHLLSIFSNVKILKIHYECQSNENYHQVTLNQTEFNRKNFTFAPILNYLIASTERIEKLKLEFGGMVFSSNTLQRILETLTAMKKLQKLSIDFSCTPQHEDIFNFLCSKPLKSLSCDFGKISLEPFLLKLLPSNSGLEHLRISAYSPLLVTKALFEKLISSGLKSCKMDFRFSSIILQDPDSFDSYLAASNDPTHLPQLSVWMWRPEEGIAPFLQYFRNLHHLQLNHISCNELQLLLKHQAQLKSLVVRENMSDTPIKMGEDDVAIFQNAFHQLTDIEHLELNFSIASYIFLKSLSPGSILENLKYLAIGLLFDQNDSNKVLPADLLSLADAAPFIEGLDLCFAMDVPFEVFLQLCNKLSRLQYFRTRYTLLILIDDWCRRDEHFPKLFSICPSLRVLLNSNPGSMVYFDIINEKLVYEWRDNSNQHYTFAEPTIGGHRVDWLTMYFS